MKTSSDIDHPPHLSLRTTPAPQPPDAPSPPAADRVEVGCGACAAQVADKLMVTAALVLLCTIQPAGPARALPWLLPTAAIVITAREITVSALREWASAAGGDAHKAVAVNNIGKWKTAFQVRGLSSATQGNWQGGLQLVTCLLPSCPFDSPDRNPLASVASA